MFLEENPNYVANMTFEERYSDESEKDRCACGELKKASENLCKNCKKYIDETMKETLALIMDATCTSRQEAVDLMFDWIERV